MHWLVLKSGLVKDKDTSLALSLSLGLVLQYFAQHSFANVCADGQGWEANNFWEEGGIVYSGGQMVHGSSLDWMELRKECKNI